jgi:hypothetical protein
MLVGFSAGWMGGWVDGKFDFCMWSLDKEFSTRNLIVHFLLRPVRWGELRVWV